MNNSDKRLNENSIKNELYGTNLMLVYCVYHGACYLRKCSKAECEKYEVPLNYKAPHAKHLSVCDETDLYNMGSFNFYENYISCLTKSTQTGRLVTSCISLA